MSGSNTEATAKRDKLVVWLQHAYPKRLLSAMMYRITRIGFRPFKNWQIRWFTRRFGVDLSVAETPEPDAFENFNAFFTRSLKAGSRPLPEAGNVAVSPADGILLDYGNVSEGSLIQAKTHRYSVSELLGDAGEAEGKFDTGSYFTVYLAPMDYHRVHMPFGGRLKEMVYVPGNLFSVNPLMARNVPRLFARNERVVSRFETGAGHMAVVMVGAIFVGSIETVWHGQVTPSADRQLTRWRYEPPVKVPVLDRGEELGRFNMGSTVVVLLQSPEVNFAFGMKPGARVKMGDALVRFASLQGNAGAPANPPGTA